MSETLPWCESCEAYSVPVENGECGECGATVQYVEADPE